MKKYMEGKQAVAKLCPVCVGVGVGSLFRGFPALQPCPIPEVKRVCARSTESLRALRRRSANEITVAV